MRKEWLAFALAMMLALGLLTAWAWHDGGIRELRPMSAPAMLPGHGQ